jgi:RNA recognition motif-containing protein
MSQYGRIEECIILKDASLGTSRGFGFVTFEDAEVSNKLIRNHVTHINGRKADIKPAEPKT